MAGSGSGSFWKRVGAFVRNPTRDWSLTDEQALAEHENLEKLKAREDQKRQDDFIRKRELDALRRLRKREIVDLPLEDSLQTNPPDTAPPLAAHARSETLRKINEIEQSMVRESVLPSGKARFVASRSLSGAADPGYATTTPLTSAPAAAMTPPPPPDPAPRAAASGVEPATEPPITSQTGADADRPPSLQPTQPLDMAPTVPMADLRPAAPPLRAPTVSPLEFDPNLLSPTQPAGDDQPTLAAATRISPDIEPPPTTAGHDSWLRSSNDFVPSAFFAVEVHDVLSSNPLFDQAVMDFANGDDTAAETALREAISDCADKGAEKELWLALFDLFRASRQTAKFEALVVDFVGRFQTSAPMFDDQPGAAAKPASAAARGGGGLHPSVVFSNPLDNGQASRLLRLLETRTPDSITLDFTAVSTIASDALATLAQAWNRLNATPCSVRLHGATELLALCALQAPPMQNGADANWWALRLEVLRLLGDQDTFDAAALDYCVTYEISPPAWEPSRARLDRDSSELPPAPGSETEGVPSTLGPGSTRSAQLQLSGEISGNSNAFLAPLDQVAKQHDQLSISLRALHRIDFSSAGALLNWAMMQRGRGKTIQFTGVHRLIAGLFSILGLHEHVLIQLRRD